MVLGGGVTGYLRGQRGIKQSMAGSKGACSSSYEILAGSFFFVSPIVCPIKEDPIVGKFRIVFLLSLSSLSQFDFLLGSNYYQDFTFLFLILVREERMMKESVAGWDDIVDF